MLVRRRIVDKQSSDDAQGRIRSRVEVVRRPKDEKPLFITVRNDITEGNLREHNNYQKDKRENNRSRKERIYDELNQRNRDGAQTSEFDGEASDDVDSDYTIEMRSQKESDDEDDDDDSVYSVEFKNFGGSDNEESASGVNEDQSNEDGGDEDERGSEVNDFQKEEIYRQVVNNEDECAKSEEDNAEDSEDDEGEEVVEQRRTVTVRKNGKPKIDEDNSLLNEKNDKEDDEAVVVEENQDVMMSMSDAEQTATLEISVEKENNMSETGIEERGFLEENKDFQDSRKGGSGDDGIVRDMIATGAGKDDSGVKGDEKPRSKDKILPEKVNVGINEKIMKEQKLREEIKLLERRLGNEQYKKGAEKGGKINELEKFTASKETLKTNYSKEKEMKKSSTKEEGREQATKGMKQVEKKDMQTAEITEKVKENSAGAKTKGKSGMSHEGKNSSGAKVDDSNEKKMEGNKVIKNDLPKSQKVMLVKRGDSLHDDKEEKKYGKEDIERKEKSKHKYENKIKKKPEFVEKGKRLASKASSQKLKEHKRDRSSDSSYSSSSVSGSSSSSFSSGKSDSESESDESESRTESGKSSRSQSESSSGSSSSSSSESESSSSEEENFKRRRRRSVESKDRRRPSTPRKERGTGYVSPLRTKRSEWGTRRRDDRPNERFRRSPDRRDYGRNPRRSREYSRERRRQRTRSRSRDKGHFHHLDRDRTRERRSSRDRDRRPRNEGDYKRDSLSRRRDSRDRSNRDRQEERSSRAYDKVKGGKSPRQGTKENLVKGGQENLVKKPERKTHTNVETTAGKEKSPSKRTTNPVEEKRPDGSKRNSPEDRMPKPLMELKVEDTSRFKKMMKDENGPIKIVQVNNEKKKPVTKTGVVSNKDKFSSNMSEKKSITINRENESKQEKKDEPKPLMKISLPVPVAEGELRNSRKVSVSSSSKSGKSYERRPPHGSDEQRRKVTRVDKSEAVKTDFDSLEWDELDDRENGEEFAVNQKSNNRIYLKRLSSGKSVSLDRRRIEPLMNPIDFDISVVLKKPRIVERIGDNTEERKSIRRVISDSDVDIPHIQITTQGKIFF